MEDMCHRSPDVLFITEESAMVLLKEMCFLGKIFIKKIMITDLRAMIDIQ